METMIERYLRVLRNADGTGGGAAGAAAGGGAAGGGNGTPAPAPAGQAGDPATAGSQPAASDYWPEGLDKGLKGADSKATLDGLAKALGERDTQLKGYRDRDAARSVPEKPEGYADFSKLGDAFKIADANKPFFDNLAKDPTFAAMAASAHKHGLGQVALADIYQTGLDAMRNSGLLEVPIDVAAERLALLPEAARSLPEAEQGKEIDKRMNANYDFLALAQANLGLPKEVADYAELMLGDSAKGHQFIEWARSKLQAGGQGPGAHGQGAAGDTRESLRADLAKLEGGPRGPNYAAEHAALMKRYETLLGQQ